MTSTPDGKSVPIFTAESIKAMSPMVQEIAGLLQAAGYIEIKKPEGRGSA